MRTMTTTMTERCEAFFSPCITLYWRGKFGKLSERWYPDTLQDRALLRQFMQEANIPETRGVSVTDDQLDAIGLAAGKHGHSTETIGNPRT